MTLTLDIYQSLWAMEQRIPGQAEDPVESHLAQIAEAVMRGLALIPMCLKSRIAQLKPAFEQHGLKCMVNAFPHDVASLEPA